MYTCPSELAEVLPAVPFDSTLTVQRHVAWEVLSDMHGMSHMTNHPILWSVEGFCGDGDLLVYSEAGTLDELYTACEKAETIHGVNGYGDKITPTFSLVS